MTTKYLVTGGLGFIGSAFIRRLFRLSEVEVVNADSESYAGDKRRLESVDGRYRLEREDVANPAFGAFVAREQPDVIVHFAAETHVTRSETGGDLFFRTNVDGTRTALEAAHAARVGLVIHVSTDEVYGSCEGEPFKEEDKEPGEGSATSPYARSKALADDLAVSYMDRVPLIVVRPTNCFGPWQHPEKAIPRWTTRALRGERLPVWGDGQQVRDWMYVDDACSAIATVIARGKTGSIYNLAPEGSQKENVDIALAVAEAAGREKDAVYLTAYDRPQHDRRYAINAARLRELGWRPSGDFESQLKTTVDWYRDSKQWWQSLVSDAEKLYRDDAERLPS